MSLVQISRALSRAVEAVETDSAAAFTYNPLDYARAPHEQYLKKWGGAPKRVLLLGMNPGPFGMAQTGVPFGDVEMVRDFLRVSGKVDRPPREHPARLIEGFACPRREVSGTRLWGWVREQFGSPEAFFSTFFVANYCPLVFMSETGKNLTPDKLPPSLAEPLLAACDQSLREVVTLLRPEWVIGVGAFAQKRASLALGLPLHRADRSTPEQVVGPKIGTILHPSPASPAANRGWAPQATAQLRALGLL